MKATYKQKQRMKEYYQKNKEKFKIKSKKYREKHKEELKEYNRKYYEEHKEELLEKSRKRSREHYKKNKEKYKKMHKKYYEEHREEILKKQRKRGYKYVRTKKGKIACRRRDLKRRAKENNIIELFSIEDWYHKRKKAKGICPYCNKEVGINNLTLDHIYPISKASKNYLKNIKNKNYCCFPEIYTLNDIQPLCVKCNSSKGGRI